jgi:hypothetical protein
VERKQVRKIAINFGKRVTTMLKDFFYFFCFCWVVNVKFAALRLIATLVSGADSPDRNGLLDYFMAQDISAALLKVREKKSFI